MDVRNVCVEYGLYMSGTNEEYTAMLEQVRASEPTPENIYLVASDIAKHSDGTCVEDVMMSLAEAVIFTYQVEE